MLADNPQLRAILTGLFPGPNIASTPKASGQRVVSFCSFDETFAKPTKPTKRREWGNFFLKVSEGIDPTQVAYLQKEIEILNSLKSKCYARLYWNDNLIVHGERNGRPLVGALWFYVAKESPYHLGVRGAELVAVMQHLWLRQVATGGRTPDTDICIVVECLQERLTKAPADPAPHIAAIERGCREFVQLWRRLQDEEAA